MSQAKKTQPDQEPETTIIPVCGPEIPKDSNPERWESTGPANGAEGIFFLGKRTIDRVIGGQLIEEVVVESLERQALRYLRPVDAEWKKFRPTMRGFCKPDLQRLMPSELKTMAEFQNRPTHWLFLADKLVNVHANQPANLVRWRVVKAEDGIWAVYFA